MLHVLAMISGYKTYIAGVGLAGLALYQFTIGEPSTGFATLMQALAAVGLRHAIAKATAPAA